MRTKDLVLVLAVFFLLTLAHAANKDRNTVTSKTW